jgi:hypothetical protein
VPKNVNDIIKRLRLAQRKAIEARAAELVTEEITLQQLRGAHKLSSKKKRRDT